MTALIIIGSILLVLLIILLAPVMVKARYVEEKFSIKVKYLGITVYPINKWVKKLIDRRAKRLAKKTDKKLKKAVEVENVEEISKESKDKVNAKTKSKKSGIADKIKSFTISDYIEIIQVAFTAIGKSTRFILKDIRVTGLNIDFLVCNEDAFEAAMSFGKINIIVHNFLAYLGSMITIKKKMVKIDCGFNSSNSHYNIVFDIKLRVLALLLASGSIILSFLKYTNQRQENSVSHKKKPHKKQKLQNAEII